MVNGLVKTFGRLPQIGEGFLGECVASGLLQWSVFRQYWDGPVEVMVFSGLMAVIYFFLLKMFID